MTDICTLYISTLLCCVFLFCKQLIIVSVYYLLFTPTTKMSGPNNFLWVKFQTTSLFIQLWYLKEGLFTNDITLLGVRVEFRVRWRCVTGDGVLVEKWRAKIRIESPKNDIRNEYFKVWSLNLSTICNCKTSFIYVDSSIFKFLSCNVIVRQKPLFHHPSRLVTFLTTHPPHRPFSVWILSLKFTSKHSYAHTKHEGLMVLVGGMYLFYLWLYWCHASKK